MLVVMHIGEDCACSASEGAFPKASGKSPQRFARFSAHDAAGRSQIAARGKYSFRERFQRRTASLSQTPKLFYFALTEIVYDSPIPPHREGRTRGRHDMRGGDAVAVSGRSVI